MNKVGGDDGVPNWEEINDRLVATVAWAEINFPPHRAQMPNGQTHSCLPVA